MEEQFILRVPPSVAERIERLLNESASSSEDGTLDLSFSEDGRSGTFLIGNDSFPASLLDLPAVVESYKTYDDNVLIKTSDIGQLANLVLKSYAGQHSCMVRSVTWLCDGAGDLIVMVSEEGDPASEGVEYKHGLTPPMRDARRRRFRREPDLNPELVQRVEKDLMNIMSGGTVENVEMAEPVADGERKKAAAAARAPAAKPDVVSVEAGGDGGEPERSDSDIDLSNST